MVATKDKGAGVDVLLSSSNEGRMTAIRNGILSLIASADSQLQPQSIHVRSDWKVADYYITENFPVVTLRLGTEDMIEHIYGRQISEAQRGLFIVYKFSAHVWAEKSYQLFDAGADESQAQARPACDLADEIMDVLLLYSGDDVSGIRFFDKVSARESEPERGPQRLTRIIIEGYVFVKRPFF